MHVIGYSRHETMIKAEFTHRYVTVRRWHLIPWVVVILSLSVAWGLVLN